MLQYLRVLHVPFLQRDANLPNLGLYALSINFKVHVINLPEFLLLVVQLKLHEIALLVEIGLLWHGLVEVQ